MDRGILDIAPEYLISNTQYPVDKRVSYLILDPKLKEAVTMTVKPIPEGYHTITPYLIVQGAVQLIAFLKQAFEAEEIFRMAQPDGTISHAEVRIGDSMVMMSEARGDLKPMPAMLHLYVEDVDAIYQRAVQAGATSLREPVNTFYGDRTGGVQDSSGNQWWIATHVEDVSADELAKRAADQARQ
jgi:uncharacterized glyoxalase superfamily protein PhnB